MSITRFLSSDPGTLDAPAVSVVLHGFGDTDGGIAPIGAALGLPWVAPRGPIALPHGGAAWFPIATPGNPDEASVAEATDVLWAWIDANLSPETKLVPVGFSQGGLMATQLLRTRPERIAATVILGGFVQAPEQPADSMLASLRPAVFWGRGADDRVLAASAIDRTASWLPVHSVLTARTYPGLAHGVNAQELADVSAFLSTAVD